MESQVYQGKQAGQELLQGEMICLLLERMELSQGFNTLEQRTNKPHTSQITLLPSKQVMSCLNDAKAFFFGQNHPDMRQSQELLNMFINSPIKDTYRTMSPDVTRKSGRGINGRS